MSALQSIDGERKAILRRIDSATYRFVGLVTRSEWVSRKAVASEILVTQRSLMSAALHVQSLNGQYPAIGQDIPAALIPVRQRIRTGKAMDAKLTAIATQRAAEKAAFKQLNSVKSQIV